MSSGHETFWSERYRSVGEDYLFGTAPSHFLASRGELLGGLGEVLSVADGEGRNAVWLAEQGCRVTATEISPVALEKAARLARGRHVDVNFVQADLLEWDWPAAAFDAVIGVFIQFVGPEERQVLFAGMNVSARDFWHCLARLLAHSNPQNLPSSFCINTEFPATCVHEAMAATVGGRDIR